MITRKLAGAVVALALTAFGALATAGPAQASTTDITLTATVKNSPDDGCPPWARDTFTRTTRITGPVDGKYTVTIADKGTFTTVKGAKSPADPTKLIEANVTGTIEGTGTFTVTGTLLGGKALANLNGKPFHNGGFDCKADVPANRTTGKWPLQFFQDGATTAGFDEWAWTYTTCAEKRSESSAGQATNNILGKTCPAEVTFTAATCEEPKARIRVANPNSHAVLKVRFNTSQVFPLKPAESMAWWFTSGFVAVKVGGVQVRTFQYMAPSGCPTPSPSPTQTETASPTPTATVSGSPSASTSPTGSESPEPVPSVSTSPASGVGGSDGGGLPLTGAPALAIGGLGLLVVATGGALFVLARRRREPDFTA